MIKGHIRMGLWSNRAVYVPCCAADGLSLIRVGGRSVTPITSKNKVDEQSIPINNFTPGTPIISFWCWKVIVFVATFFRGDGIPPSNRLMADDAYTR
ncbi:TPA: hypothetical protein L9N04_004818 [Klebsiella pneumoniae]|nr:hypothetical protein [Klebsiella pneumoniae]